ncbi:uncharacterized protein LOC132629150 [Lycium barbarum]|uniref:uncharacterized protein LOC132629150 n=1 Tax=Lycium barbarum TaxID=112863 RepID=UPI00293E3BB1|nr:uncharacterized protein LOC132629150 [Lycium barbarum]
MIEIEDLQMWLQRWTPDFKPEEDIPLAPIWALLPGLPFHMHNWVYIKQIVEAAGTPIEVDLATKNMNRPSMAKVRIEIDLLKPLVTNVWIGNEDEDSPLRGFTQKIEYESIPKYCKHCRKLGHNLANCRTIEKKKLEQNQVNPTIKENIKEPKLNTNSKNDLKGVQDVKGAQDLNLQKNNRGRERQITNKDFGKHKRGKSEPPKGYFRPTGAIFGKDKPLPTSEKTSTNITNNTKQNESDMEKKKEDDEIHVIQKGDDEIQVNNIPEASEKAEGGTESNRKDQGKRETFMIKDPSELHVDLFGEDWQEPNIKKDKKNKSKNGSPRHNQMVSNTNQSAGIIDEDHNRFTTLNNESESTEDEEEQEQDKYEDTYEGEEGKQ